MGSFSVCREVAAPAVQVWSALVDWPAHGRWAPLTRVRSTSPAAGGVGASFVGRTGLGPLAFDDPMVVTEWQPPDGDRPGHCMVRKTGRVLLGNAGFTVTPLGPRRCRVDWTETVEVAALRRVPLAGRVSDAVGRVTFALVVRRMAREVQAQ